MTEKYLILRIFYVDYGSFTEVTHDAQDDFIYMEPCQSSMCFNKPINYSASDAQIKALMEISESCTQYIEVKPGKTYFFTRMLSLILLLRLLFQSYVYDGCTVFRMCNAGL